MSKRRGYFDRALTIAGFMFLIPLDIFFPKKDSQAKQHYYDSHHESVTPYMPPID
jgi:hypothetical protein